MYKFKIEIEIDYDGELGVDRLERPLSKSHKKCPNARGGVATSGRCHGTVWVTSGRQIGGRCEGKG
jgi:hypothetical protein